MSRTPQFRQGQAVRIDGHVADADGSMHGDIGHVTGRNHTERGSDGIERTLVTTKRGEVVAVPSRALRSEDTR